MKKHRVMAIGWHLCLLLCCFVIVNFFCFLFKKGEPKQRVGMTFHVHVCLCVCMYLN